MKIILGLFFCLSLVIVSNAQEVKQHEINKLRENGQSNSRCFVETNVMTPKMFEQVQADEDCAAQTKALNVNFEKETLFVFKEEGDCHLSIESRIFRDDEAKKIRIKIKNFYGGCRAAGWFQSWIVIEKIPSDYAVEFSHQLLESDGNKILSEEVIKLIPPQP